jgi:hypothetical protein
LFSTNKAFPNAVFIFYFVSLNQKTSNMKKTIVGAIVGGIILFAWQFLSWAALNLHEKQQQYTPKQDSIMAYLNTQFSEDGGYYLPNFAPGTSDEQMKTEMKVREGKPWAQISYHKSMPGMDKMFMNMGRGLLINIFTIWLLCWLLVKIPSPSFGTIFLGTLFTGLIVFFNAPYIMHIWYQSFDLMVHFTDALVAWGATGIWLGWWLTRKK